MRAVRPAPLKLVDEMRGYRLNAKGMRKCRQPNSLTTGLSDRNNQCRHFRARVSAPSSSIIMRWAAARVSELPPRANPRPDLVPNPRKGCHWRFTLRCRTCFRATRLTKSCMYPFTMAPREISEVHEVRSSPFPQLILNPNCFTIRISSARQISHARPPCGQRHRNQEHPLNGRRHFLCATHQGTPYRFATFRSCRTFVFGHCIACHEIGIIGSPAGPSACTTPSSFFAVDRKYE